MLKTTRPRRTEFFGATILTPNRSTSLRWSLTANILELPKQTITVQRYFSYCCVQFPRSLSQPSTPKRIAVHLINTKGLWDILPSRSSSPPSHSILGSQSKSEPTRNKWRCSSCQPIIWLIASWIFSGWSLTGWLQDFPWTHLYYSHFEMEKSTIR